MYNIPTDASFAAVGLFPSHQLWNNPIELFEPSTGLLYSRIGQKYDLRAPIASGPRTRPPRTAARTSAVEVGQISLNVPIYRGFVRQSPLGDTNAEHPSNSTGVS
jgi:hypothetical protein